MTNFFFRTNTMGAMEQEDDINFDENTWDVVFKVRALKGRLLATPILKRLKPVTQPEKDRREKDGPLKHHRHHYFDLLRRTKETGTSLNTYTNCLTATGEIGKYIEDLFTNGFSTYGKGPLGRSTASARREQWWRQESYAISSWRSCHGGTG